LNVVKWETTRIVNPFLRATAGTAIARLNHRCRRTSVTWVDSQKGYKLGSRNLHCRSPGRLATGVVRGTFKWNC